MKRRRVYTTAPCKGKQSVHLSHTFFCLPCHIFLSGQHIKQFWIDSWQHRARHLIMAAWRGMKKVTLDTHRRKQHTRTGRCALKVAALISDITQIGRGDKNYPLTSSREPSTFVIPFDQISVRDECHAPFQPAVRGLPSDSVGCVCVESCVCCTQMQLVASEVRKRVGGSHFQPPVPSFNSHPHARRQIGIVYNQSTAAWE